MYSVTILTKKPDLVLTALKRSKVDHEVGRIVQSGALKGAQRPGVAARIYDMVEDGDLSYDMIAAQCQVSRDTVMRVIANPKKYGVSKPPLSRSK